MAVKTPNTKQEQDEAYNPANLNTAEQSKDGYTSAGKDQMDRIEAYANDPANSSKNTQDAEENPLNYSQSGKEDTEATLPKKVSLFVKKRAASITVTVILGGFGIGASFFSIPSLLLVQMKEVLTNYGSSASRVADSRFENSLYYRLTGGTASACRSPGAMSTIRCKRGTINEKNHQKLKDSGFNVRSQKIGGRYVITSISKDGVNLNGKSSRANIKAAMAHPDFGSSMRSTINARSNVFNGGRFSSLVLKSLGVDKSKVDLKGNTDEKRKEAANKLTGAADEDTEEKRKAKFEGKFGEKIKGVGKIGKGPAAAVGVVCSGYNMSRATITALKLYNAARYVSLAMLFLKAADQIKANGEVDPTTIALLGGVLTSYYTSGPMKGLTATDSQGYKVAAYGGEGALKSFSKKFLLGGNDKLVDLDKSIDTIQDKTPGGKQTLKTSCRAATDPVAGIGIAAAMCGVAAGVGGGGGFLAGTVVPVIGNAIGGAAGAVTGAGVCVAASVAGSLAAGAVIGKIFEYVLPKVVDYLADAPIDVNKIKGVEAGDALAAGTGVIMEKTNASRGLQPGTKASVTAFQTDTFEDQENYTAIAKYDAQKEPFNAYSEYSFLGSFVRKSGLSNMRSGTFASSMSTLSNVLLSSVRFSPVASAASPMSLNITAEDLSHCTDKDLKGIGVDCDVTGGTQYSMATNIPDAENIKFMEVTHAHADESGAPISEEYKNWAQNCTDQRTDPLGTTSAGIEDEDDWKTGKACVAGSTAEINQTTRDQFSTYYNAMAAQEDEDNETSEPASDDSADNSDSSATIAGDLAWPLDKKFWISSKADWLDAHSASSGTWTSGVDSLAVDIQPESNGGQSVYAMAGGKVSKMSLRSSSSKTDHGLEITSQVDGGTLEIAYAHGPRTSPSKTSYQAGEKIMTVGQLGNASGPHLHIDMAFNGKGVCPQLVFPLIESGDPIDWGDLASRSKAPCG